MRPWVSRNFYNIQNLNMGVGWETLHNMLWQHQCNATSASITIKVWVYNLLRSTTQWLKMMLVSCRIKPIRQSFPLKIKSSWVASRYLLNSNGPSVLRYLQFCGNWWHKLRATLVICYKSIRNELILVGLSNLFPQIWPYILDVFAEKNRQNPKN